MAFMTLEQIDVSYDKKKQILKGLDLSVEKGELVSLLGPSGCGKTTTLRVVAGFIEPQNGTFTLDGEDLTKVPVHKRNFGIVFQSYALFPHLSVYDNVAFGLRTRKMAKETIDQKVKSILEVCGLSELAERFPKEMSGGQRQRVALARALVIEPKLLLLDEPLSNLDAKLRISMRVEIKRLQKKLGITTLFVTHDQEECFSISDKVAIMDQGVIEQYDSPENIYKRPATEFVARFIGFENFLDLRPSRGAEHIFKAPDGSSFCVDMDWGGEPFVGTIRPDDIRLAERGQKDNVLPGVVGVRTFLGKSYQYEVETAAGVLKVNMAAEKVFNEGDGVRLYLPEDKLVLVRKQSE
ncbi:MAG: ABC transporter ATP-binding protein [Lachnospiraceae bacterium]|nr:ABC transporter ATP-binding protein [Lachnospiraceae bacterium]